MRKKAESLTAQGKKRVGRPSMGAEKRVKLTLTLSPSVVEAAHNLPGSLSQRVEAHLVRDIAREGKRHE